MLKNVSQTLVGRDASALPSKIESEEAPDYLFRFDLAMK